MVTLVVVKLITVSNTPFKNNFCNNANVAIQICSRSRVSSIKKKASVLSIFSTNSCRARTSR